MTADANGNDLTAVDVVITAALAIAPYEQANILTSEAGGGENADLPAAYMPLGLIKSDGGATESMDQEDPIEFLQDGYQLSADPTISIQYGLAEFNRVVRQLTTGKTPDANGMIEVETYTPDTKWCLFYEEVYKNGRVRRLNGVVQVTTTEIDQSERGAVKGRNVTLTWKTDPWVGNGKTTKFLEWHYPEDDAAPDPVKPVTGVTADKTGVLLDDTATTVDVTLTVTPDDATVESVTAVSDHPDVASVRVDGLKLVITRTGYGTARITATVDGHDVTINVTAQGLQKLTVAATARLGGQTVTVTPAVGEGLQRRYRIDQTAPTIAYDDVVDTAHGWLAWPDNGEVTGSAGQTITVVDNTVQGAKARKHGSAKLPATLVAVYYGCVNANTAEALTADAIKALTSKTASGSAAGDYAYTPDATANDGDGQYTLLAAPAGFPTPTFTMGGLDYPVDKLAANVTIDGVEYSVWTSSNQQTEALTVKAA